MRINLYEIWALVSVSLKIVAYVPYFKHIIKGKCHPHSFSWFIWFVIIFIAFLVQFLGGAGAGAFATLFASLICLAIAVLGFLIGRRDIVFADYIVLVAAMTILPLWYFVHSPLTVIAVVIAVDMMGFIPTWRKAFLKPFEERGKTFFILSISSVFGIIAVEEITAANLAYPVYLSISHLATAFYIAWRNKAVIGRWKF